MQTLFFPLGNKLAVATAAFSPSIAFFVRKRQALSSFVQFSNNHTISYSGGGRRERLGGRNSNHIHKRSWAEFVLKDYGLGLPLAFSLLM